MSYSVDSIFENEKKEIIMNPTVLFSAVATIIVSLVMGVFVLFLGFRLFSRFTHSINEEEELQNNNIAVAILCGSLIFSLGYIMKSAVYPLVRDFFNILIYSDQGSGRIVLGFGLILLQFFSALVISIGSLWLGVKGFSWLTKNIDEFEEIRRNNTAVSILMAVIVITLALFLQEGVEKLLQVIRLTPGISNSGLTPFG